MNDQLSGQIDLSRLFDTEAAQGLIESLALHGASTARDAHAICAIIGSPLFDDVGVASAAEGRDTAAAFLATWRRYGVNAVSRIRGGYALVVADAAHKSVFLAVDRFAIQTLCYCIDGQTLTFSDRADCVEGRGNDLDQQAIFDYLFFHMIPAPRTIFRKVRRLPAAHGLLISQKGVQEIRHWPLRFDEHHHEPFSRLLDCR